MMSPLLLVAALVVAAPEANVRVNPLAGQRVEGKLVLLDGEKVVVETADGGPQDFVVSELRSITVQQPSSAGPKAGGIQIQLTDGSLLLAHRFQMEQGRAKVVFAKSGASEPSMEFSTRAIHWVRLDHRRQPAIDKQWREILADQSSGDVLVARRESVEEVEAGNTVTEQAALALDPYEGLLRGVTATNARFEIDGDQFTPSLEKLEGFVFRQSSARRLPPIVCNLVDSRGSRWSLQALVLADNTIGFKTAFGIEHRLPLSEVASLDFAGANIVYLSDVEPESTEWAPFIAQSSGGDNLAELFSFRRDRSLDGGSLQLDGVQYEKGLGIHSRTQLVYRVPEGFSRFRAVVGINDRVCHLGNVQLVISGDQKVLYEQSVEAREGGDRSPGDEIDMDLSGVRRLTILVDFGGGLLDVADHLDLCDARFTK